MSKTQSQILAPVSSTSHVKLDGKEEGEEEEEEEKEEEEKEEGEAEKKKTEEKDCLLLFCVIGWREGSLAW